MALATLLITTFEKGMTVNDRNQALQDKLDAEIEQARLQIDRLEAKAKEARADARLELSEQANKLKEKRADAKAKLDEIRDAGGQALEDLQAGAEHAWQSLATATKRATDRFR